MLDCRHNERGLFGVAWGDDQVGYVSNWELELDVA